MPVVRPRRRYSDGRILGRRRRAQLEGFAARRAHLPALDQLVSLGDVDLAPVAARLAGREADRVAVLVVAAADAVDPAEAQGHVDRLRPGHARLAAAALLEADRELRGRLVVALQPGGELARRGEELRRRHARSRRPARAWWRRRARWPRGGGRARSGLPLWLRVRPRSPALRRGRSGGRRAAPVRGTCRS